MRRYVQQSVAGHDAVPTSAARPVVFHIVLVSEADEFRPAKLSNQVVGCSFGGVATQVVAGALDGTWIDLFLERARFEIVASDLPGVGVPYEVVDHHHIGAAHRNAAGRLLPRQLAGR